MTDENHELWGEVAHNLQRGDIPPEDAKQPKAALQTKPTNPSAPCWLISSNAECWMKRSWSVEVNSGDYPLPSLGRRPVATTTPMLLPPGSPGVAPREASVMGKREASVMGKPMNSGCALSATR